MVGPHGRDRCRGSGNGSVALALMAAVWVTVSRLDTSDVFIKWHKLTSSAVVRGFVVMGYGIYWGIVGRSSRIASQSISIRFWQKIARGLLLISMDRYYVRMDTFMGMHICAAHPGSSYGLVELCN